MSTSALAWHYTTSEGFLSILQNHRMWAGSAAYMNDGSDILTGRRAIREVVDARKAGLQDWQLDQLRSLGVLDDVAPHSYFILCGSSEGDELSLWRSYGAAYPAEYAIGLDPEVRLEPILQKCQEKHPSPAPVGWYDNAIEYTDDGQPFESYDPDEAHVVSESWKNVKYLELGNTHAEDELDRLLAMLREPSGTERRVIFNFEYSAGLDPTVFFKNSGFVDEREMRAAWRVSPWWRFVRYRSTRFGVTPYIEVGARRVPGDSPGRAKSPLLSNQLGRLPLRSVRIGPTRSGHEAQLAVEGFLAAHGYSDIQVERSETPFR